LLDAETQRYLPPAALAERFERAGVNGDRPVVTYCGGGIAATTDAFALSLLGRDDVQVYDGSLAEWANDPARPMEVG
jgi:thiosulfate/3-mercaptopyruvate sulfurtransferase